MNSMLINSQVTDFQVKLAFDEQEMMVHCLGWETATNLALALHDAQCDLNAGKIKRWRPLLSV